MLKSDGLTKEIFRLCGITSHAEFRMPLPVVPLELFFNENNEISSIGCNLLEHPGTKLFHEKLSALKARSDVQDVLVEIYEVEPGEWPFSERVYVLTSASPEEIMGWLEALEPSDITEFQPDDVKDAPGFPDIKPGMKIQSVWWD